MKKLILVVMMLLVCSLANAETVRKVDIFFRGYYACNETQLEQAWATYNQWAVTYGLVKMGFSVVERGLPDGSKVIEGVRFRYGIGSMLESNLINFLNTWYTVTSGAGVDREEMSVRFFTVEE